MHISFKSIIIKYPMLSMVFLCKIELKVFKLQAGIVMLSSEILILYPVSVRDLVGTISKLGAGWCPDNH